MTLREVSSQLFHLSVNGGFNRERFTAKKLLDVLTAHMQEAQFNPLPNTFVMEIELPDGWWFFTVNKYGDDSNDYDYWIPDTREQEQKLWDRFTLALTQKVTTES